MGPTESRDSARQRTGPFRPSGLPVSLSYRRWERQVVIAFATTGTVTVRRVSLPAQHWKS